MFEKKHEMLRKLAREFAEKELEPIADEAEKNGHARFRHIGFGL